VNYDDVKIGMDVTTPHGKGTVKKKHNPQVLVGGSWFYSSQIDPVVAMYCDPTYTRDELVRAIVGQQWAVAIACHFDNHFWVSIEGANLADLPCAVDVVGGLG